MNIKHENVPGQVQELVIEIQKEDYAEKVENALKKQRREIAVPGFRKESRLRALHCQVYIPAFMMHSPHAAHAAVDGIIKDFIGIEDRIILFDLLVGDRLGFLSFFLP